jgi:hypothetical protein
MNTINKIIQRIRIVNQPIFLGRWKITYCKPSIDRKIDLANEDHCGACYPIKYHNTDYIKYENKKNIIIDLE